MDQEHVGEFLSAGYPEARNSCTYTQLRSQRNSPRRLRELVETRSMPRSGPTVPIESLSWSSFNLPLTVVAAPSTRLPARTSGTKTSRFPRRIILQTVPQSSTALPASGLARPSLPNRQDRLFMCGSSAFCAVVSTRVRTSVPNPTEFASTQKSPLGCGMHLPGQLRATGM